jgi:Flp pilus assembly protein TadG
MRRGNVNVGGERGSITVMTALLLVGLCLAVGLCLDVARFYMARAELQNAADASALAAARELNSYMGGLESADARARAVANTYGFGHTGVHIEQVEFAVNLGGPYTAWDPSLASDLTNPVRKARFVRVTTEPAHLPVIFAGSVLGTTHDERGVATAGMSVGLNVIGGFFPVAAVLANPNPAPHTLFTLKFTQGTGNFVKTYDQQYVVLDVPDINGNGAAETRALVGGVTSMNAHIGQTLFFNHSPSANQNNGPKQLEDGTNTRFDIYPGGNAVTPALYPPDTNVREGITAEQYFDGTAVTPPPNNPPGVDYRRVLVMPIITPTGDAGGPPSANVVKFGAFLLRSRVVNQTPCSQPGNICGDLNVEYLTDDITVGTGGFDPGLGGSSIFHIAVLYR